ncbi:DUF418 domain-containing protein [Massilia sp. BJB1822]|uniref:DUF418 domain-containing protein n=1 Tax=Massilia sp. BJB1822 TaxID=2744470 RepID=UPI001C3E2C6F|nr:heparan-alpha-glucosaminide N-acetyltransferase domain-containing protein [Massilia sp. BJB1822]
MNKIHTPRLEGLDLARCLALIGMVLVNFRLAMGATTGGPPWLGRLLEALEGRSAATFVTLAGIGLALASRKLAYLDALSQTARRAVILMAVGLVNFLVFPADIIHYYAIYFIVGALCLPLATRWLLLLIGAIAAVFTALLFAFDYGYGWNWNDLSYPDFWTPQGFARNLFFNGWHPVLPWAAFFLWGLVLARLRMEDPQIQRRMIAGGSGAAMLAYALSAAVNAWYPSLGGLFGVTPLPPVPLYLLAGGGIATAVIGVCLWAAQRWHQAGWLQALLPAGRMTLTLYIAHILLGMGVLEQIGWLQGRSMPQAVLASLLYCAAALGFAWLWAQRVKRGPLETLMHRLIA